MVQIGTMTLEAASLVTVLARKIDCIIIDVIIVCVVFFFFLNH